MSANDLSGRCLCGAVRYECGPQLIPACFCHCESCRRASGAHLVAWVSVSNSTFKVVQGEVRQYASSPGVLRQFCGLCGSPLTYWSDKSPRTIDVTLTTLETAAAIEPAEHIWMDDALPWDRPADGLPQYPTTRRES